MFQVNYIGVLQKIDRFFNRTRIFTINKRVLINNNIYYYWLKENSREVKNRFFKEELFALNGQFKER